MPTPWKREPVYKPESAPSSIQKPSMSLFERLGITGPAPKKESVVKPPELKKLFGDKGYAAYPNLREFARKLPFDKTVMPDTVRKLGKNERVALIEELRQRAEKALKAPSSTLSERTYRERIRPQIRKEENALAGQYKTTELRNLKRKERLWEQWIKGVPK